MVQPFKDIKPDDFVFEVEDSTGCMSLHTVSHVTSTLIAVGERRYRLDTGHEREPKGSTRHHLIAATPENMDAYRAQGERARVTQLARKLNDFDFRSLETPVLDEVARLVFAQMRDQRALERLDQES